MDLHPECQQRLREIIAEALSQALVRNGKILDILSLHALENASEILPRQVQGCVAEWISDYPVRDFVFDRRNSGQVYLHL